MDTNYGEHGLPHDQPLITTNDMEHLMEQINEWKDSLELFPASLGLAVGAHGIGKTIAAQRCILSNEADQHSKGACVKVMSLNIFLWLCEVSKKIEQEE